MKQHFDLIVVIPAGPGTRLDFVTDTMESVRRYTSGSLKFILVDDSQKGTGLALAKSFPGLDLLVITRNLGKVGGLYISLSAAFRHALEQYDFDLLLRMDDDALLTGPDPHLDARALLAANPQAGIIGRHIHGRFSPDEFGNAHDNAYPRNTLLAGTCSLKAIKRPLVNLALRRLMMKAMANGYELGENIQGGAYFITRHCIQKLADAGLLPLPRLKDAILCEDHLFSLLAKVVGTDLCDLSGARQPFGIAWKGLPAPPERLLRSGKKIVHSLRFWRGQDEASLRDYFKQQRSGAPAPRHQHALRTEVKICG